MDINLVAGTVGIPVAIAFLNFLVRYLGKLSISPSSDLLLVLLCLDISNLISMDFFKKVVQSELIKGNLHTVVVFLMMCTLAAWLFNILAVEKSYEARHAAPVQKDRFFVGDFDCKKILLLGASFVLSVVIFGLHVCTVVYKGMEG